MPAGARWCPVNRQVSFAVLFLFVTSLFTATAALVAIPDPGGGGDGGDDGNSCTPSCGAYETCDDGSCETAPDAECSSDSECSTGEECSSGECVDQCPADDMEFVEGHGCAPTDRECIEDTDCSQDNRRRTCNSDYECEGSHLGFTWNGEMFTGSLCNTDDNIEFVDTDDYGWQYIAFRRWDEDEMAYTGEISEYECDEGDVCYDWQEDSSDGRGANDAITLEVDANCYGVSVSTSMPQYTDGDEPVSFDVGGLYDGG